MSSPVFQHILVSTVSNMVKAANAESDRVREDLLGADLPAKIISKVKRSSEDGGMDTSCVQLFICRMSPIIWGLQVEGFHIKYHNTSTKTPSTKILKGFCRGHGE